MPDCNLTVNLVRILIVEGRIPSKHFEYEHSESPPVNSQVVPDTHDNLRGQVLWRAAQSESSVLDLLSKAKVSYLQMAVSCDKQVLRLQVSVRYFLLVQVLQSQHNLCHIKERDIVGKQVLLAQQSENLTALHVLKRQVHVRLVFKALMSKRTNQ